MKYDKKDVVINIYHNDNNSEMLYIIVLQLYESFHQTIILFG